MKTSFFRRIMERSMGHIIGLVLLSLFSSYLTIYLAKFIMFAIDGIVTSKMELPIYLQHILVASTVWGNLLRLAGVMLIIVIVLSLILKVREKVNRLFSLRMNQNAKNILLEHVMELEYHSIREYGKDNILQRMNQDCEDFTNYLYERITLFIDTFFLVIFSVKEIFQMDPMVSIALVVIIFAISLFSIWYYKKSKPIALKNVELNKQLTSKTLNTVYNNKIIRMSNRQSQEYHEFQKLNETYNKNSKKFIKLLIFYEIISDQTRLLKNPIIFCIAGIAILNGNLNMGAFLVMITYTDRLMEYVSNTIYAVENINQFVIPYQKMKQLFSIPKENKSGRQMQLETSICFDHVTIQFENHLLFDEISFQIDCGDKVHIVGENGSGKSILVKTLLGFYPYTGDIYIGGINLKELSYECVRKQIGLILQDPFVFGTTIRNNIDVEGKEERLETIRQVAKICDLEEDIEGFEKGYETVIGDRGITLSGGQKQRLAMARTLLQNKKILIFDDVLSKLDQTTRNHILNNLENLEQKFTVLNITHDIAKIEDQEKVLFIQNKKGVVQTHQELLKQNQDYAHLAEIAFDSIGEEYE